jgi:hypothetical protein
VFHAATAAPSPLQVAADIHALMQHADDNKSLTQKHLLLYRTRFPGHAVALCGAPEAGVEACGARVERAESPSEKELNRLNRM